MPPSRRGSKRANNGRSPSSRVRKKQKRLDSIVDKTPLVSTPSSSSSKPVTLDSSSEKYAAPNANAADDRGCLRRSSRPRRAPDVLDSSPVPSNRMQNKTKPSNFASPRFKLSNKVEDDRKSRTTKTKEKKSVSVSVSLLFQEEEKEEDSKGWRSRLRSRAMVRKREGDSGRVLRKGRLDRGKKGNSRPIDEINKEEESDGDGDDDADEDGVDRISEEEEEEENGFPFKTKELETCQQVKEPNHESNSKEMEIDEQAEEPNVKSDLKEMETSEQAEEVNPIFDLKVLETSEQAEDGNAVHELKELEISEQVEGMNVVSEMKELETTMEAEGTDVAADLEELESSRQAGVAREDGKGNECTNAVEVEEQEKRLEPEKIVATDEMDSKSDEIVISSNAARSEKAVKGNDNEEKNLSKRLKEGRRCGLCGGGTDGKPPKKLARESVESDKEAYEGSSASEEPNYDIWDGFGDEPGWLGRLLGPIHDRFGIARVWVHQHCAVWSPEVS